MTVFIVDETYAFRLDHQVGRLFQTGPDCSIFKIDFGMGTWGLTDNDVRRVVRIAERLTAAINGHDRVRITSRRGTDLTLSIAGRECLPIYPVPDRGAPYGLSVPLWGEYNWAPIEDSAHGRIVIDGLTEAGPTMAAVSEPVMMSIEGGRVVDVTGSRDAEDFQRLFKTDAGAAVVGELGVGGNPKALPGHESEKALLGTVHFGFGRNHVYPGGQNDSAVHVDGVVRDVTLTVDGEPVLLDGRLVINSNPPISQMGR